MMRKRFTAAVALALLALARMAYADGPVVITPAGACCQGGCDSCCLQKVCKPIVEPKTVIKPVFTSVCEDYCEPRCWSCSLFGGGCSECGPCHNCGNVKTRKILVVKLVKHEECVNKCVVDYVAPCCTAAPCCTSTTVIMQPAQGAPVIMQPAQGAPVAAPLRMPMTPAAR